jgi:hypothetical protein
MLSPAEDHRASQLGLDRSVMEQIKSRSLPTRADLATYVVNLAILQHDHGKYVEAEASYRRAQALYRSSSSLSGWRQVILPWIEAQIANCQQSHGPDELALPTVTV